MMRASTLERALWLATLFSVTGAVMLERTQSTEAPAASRGIPPRTSGAGISFSDDSLAAAAAMIVRNDPFRVTHQPATLSYGTGVETLKPTVPRPPRPILTLQGVIGRPNRWEAVIAGIPGRDGGVVVRPGDTLAGLRIRRIGRDTVVVGAVDTIWKLTVKGVWP
jgi:hypothetical protein